MHSGQVQTAYFTWFIFDLSLDDDRTVTDSFLEREGGKLSPGERSYLELMRDSHLRLYEVLETKRNQGVALRDLWDGKRLWVVEGLASRRLVSGDIFAARVARESSGESVFETEPYLFWPSDKDQLVKGFCRAYRIFTVQLKEKGTVNFFKKMGPLFHQWWLELVALAPPPKIICAEDGQRFVFADVVFDLLDRRALDDALAARPEFAKNSDGSYAWFQDARERQRCHGVVIVADRRVVVETTSKGRAERARDVFPSLVGQSVKFKVIVYQDVGQALKRAPARAEEEVSGNPSESQAGATAESYEQYEQYYRKWLDQSLPALGNRTPRRGARLKTVRPKLIALLKDFESHSERERRSGQIAYDFTWMWAELGLTRE
jgi:hypothetical protein